MKKRIKNLMAVSLVAGSLFTGFAMADDFDFGKWIQCVSTCQGNCTISGICYEEIK